MHEHSTLASTLTREANLKMAIVFPSGDASLSSLSCHLERKRFIIRKEEKNITTQHIEYLDEMQSNVSYQSSCIQNLYFVCMKDTY
jgi:hypothetical protein